MLVVKIVCWKVEELRRDLQVLKWKTPTIFLKTFSAMDRHAALPDFHNMGSKIHRLDQAEGPELQGEMATVDGTSATHFRLCQCYRISFLGLL